MIDEFKRKELFDYFSFISFFFFVIIKNRDSWDEHSKFNIARRSIKKSILLRTSDDYRYL